VDLEEVWRIREEEIYPRLFGSPGRGIFVLTAEVFGKLGHNAIDPTWLTYGVFEFAPTLSRSSWIYVTSGNSNPWHQEPAQFDPNSRSGRGLEFLLASTEKGDWAIRCLLNLLAYDILLAHGLLTLNEPIDSGHCIALNGPINGDPRCVIRHVLVSHAEELAGEFTLPSGKVDVLTFTGATDAEIAFARDSTTTDLFSKLKAAGQYPVTDPKRRSIL
jgi:hypothetical protein